MIRRSVHNGFTLLEAIVALALLSSLGVALFGWLNTNLITLIRVESAIERRDAIDIGLTYIGDVNPMQQPNGSSQIEDYSISWRSNVLEGPVDGVLFPSTRMSGFQVALYDTRVTVYRDGNEIASFSILQAGFNRVRGRENTGEPG